jgi:hypothetical protein
VAIAVPVVHSGSATNWMHPDTVRFGVVGDPPRGWVPPETDGMGHAVCVVAFHRDPAEPAGGWFVFRNSHGLDWARAAPAAVRPRVPHAGFGAISASYVDGYCWEMLSLT